MTTSGLLKWGEQVYTRFKCAGETCKMCTDFFFVQNPVFLLQVSSMTIHCNRKRCKHVCTRFKACVSAKRCGKHAARLHNQNCFVVLICTDVSLLLARAMWKSPIPQAMTAMQQQQVNQDILRGRGPKWLQVSVHSVVNSFGAIYQARVTASRENRAVESTTVGTLVTTGLKRSVNGPCWNLNWRFPACART